MNTARKTLAQAALLLMPLFLLSGCHLFTEANNKLHLYCPGLKISIDGVSYSVNGSRDAYVLNYDHSFQKQVQTYFENKKNGFEEKTEGDFYDIEVDNDNVIDKNDHVLCKTIKTKTGREDVVFDETTRRIVFVEYSN
jgi:hypothetical protein